MAEKYIAYYRVSTDRQGRSGLGIEAQRAAVSRHTQGGELVAEYTETESGGRSDRAELSAALGHCRRAGAVLVIAKLDRLARSVHFISGLMESGVEFVACDNPHASKLMLHMLAAFAEHEREQISQRTKEALAAAKARGVELGNPELDELNERHRLEADEFARSMVPIIEELQGEGITSQRAIAEALNRREIPTATGNGRWHQRTVHALLQRIEKVTE